MLRLLPILALAILLVAPTMASAQRFDGGYGNSERGERGERRERAERPNRERRERGERPGRGRPVNAIPEPSAALAFGLGAIVVGAATARRRRR